MSIASLSRLTPTGQGRFTGGFDSSWGQGPGVFGGLVAAALGSCLEQVEPDRALRVLSMQLCAPVTPGPVEITVQRERQGSAASFFSGRVLVGGQPAVLASAMCSRDRTTEVDFDHAVAPTMPSPDSLPDLGTAPGVPVFTQHFAFRFTHGVPFTAQPVARTGGWVRPVEPEPMSTALALALLDVWPLAVLPVMQSPRPAASVAIHMQLMPPLVPRAPEAWYAIDVVSSTCRGGYSEQVSSLFDAQGRLIGRCQQLTAVIR